MMIRPTIRAVLSDRAARKSTPAPRYRIACRCGAWIEGERREQAHVASCNACGESRLVLPISRWSTPDVAAAGAETTPVEPAVATPGPSPADENRRSPIAERMARRLRRWFALPRILAAVIVLLIAVTTAYSWRAVRRDQFRRDLEKHLESGSEAFEEGDFIAATRDLSIAASAAEGLGGASDSERQAVQWSREAEIWSRLTITTFDDFFASADAPLSEWSEPSYRAAFDQLMAGRTIVVDTTVRARESVATADRDASENPWDWHVVGDGWQVRLDPQTMSMVDANGMDEGDRVVFGGRLASIRRARAGSAQWLLRFEPASLTWLTVRAPFDTFGWPEDLELIDLLENQRRRVHAEREVE